MIADKLAVLRLATEYGIPVALAARRALVGATYEELLEAEATRLANAATREARRQVTTDLPDMTAEQLSLFTLHYDLPALVRTVVAGEEVFIHWQNATLDEHAESLRYRREHHIQQAGIAERLEQRIWETNAPRDVAAGYIIWPHDLCSICGGPWLQNDKGGFEEAHDMPVAGRSGTTEIRWAHRECNRSEGT